MVMKIDANIEEIKSWVSEEDVFDVLTAFDLIERKDRSMDLNEKVSILMNCYVGYLINGASEKEALVWTIQRHCQAEKFSKNSLEAFLDRALDHDIEKFWKDYSEAISQVTEELT